MTETYFNRKQPLQHAIQTVKMEFQHLNFDCQLVAAHFISNLRLLEVIWSRKLNIHSDYLRVPPVCQLTGNQRVRTLIQVSLSNIYWQRMESDNKSHNSKNKRFRSLSIISQS